MTDEALAGSALADDATIDSLMELAASVARAAGTQAATGWLDDIATGACGAGGDHQVEPHRRGDAPRQGRRAADRRHARRARPDDAIVGEEGTDRPGTSGVRWYSTRSTAPPTSSTASLSGAHRSLRQTPMAFAGAATSAPRPAHLAGRGRGATCNGSRSRQRQTGSGSPPGHRVRLTRRRAPASRRIGRIGPAVRDLRRTGSAAIDLVFTHRASSTPTRRAPQLWDMAAGELIAREAGCRSGDFTGGPTDPQLLVTAPALFDTFCAARRSLSKPVASSGADIAQCRMRHPLMHQHGGIRHDGAHGYRIPLAVEDDERIREAAGWRSRTRAGRSRPPSPVRSPSRAFDRQPADVVLIDIMLPGIDGFELCRTIRRRSDVPIVMVTAQRHPRHRRRAEAGADDYMTKPFSRRSCRRIRALLRGSARRSSATRSWSTVTSRSCRRGQGHARRRGGALTKTEFRLLCELALNRGKVFSRELLDRAREYDYLATAGSSTCTSAACARSKPTPPTHATSTVRGSRRLQ